MPVIKGVAHFSIAVSDPEKSAKFYTEVVGCKLLHAQPNGKITFLDAAGVCLLLIKRPAPIHKGPPEMSDGVHHAFILDADEYQSAVDGLRARGVDVFFEEDRRGGVIDGPRAYSVIRTARHWNSSIAPLMQGSDLDGGAWRSTRPMPPIARQYRHFVSESVVS